jgi:raffinose/stachyose/melibiose transport system substrate-binding protein
MRRTFKAALGAEVAALALLAGLASAKAGSLKIESWRNDDADIWNSKIIPAFNKQYPDIKIEFAPSAPKEYNAALNARLDGGTAGDLITCRPFDASLALRGKPTMAKPLSVFRSPPLSPGSSTTRRPSPRSA